jgi:site-specific recombinase XerD
MKVEDYLGRSLLFRRLRNGPHGQLVDRYATRLVEERFAGRSTWHCLNIVSGFMSWIAKCRYKLADIDELKVERYLRHRASKQCVRSCDSAALRRWLSVLRDEGAIVPVALPPLTLQDRIVKEFVNYLQTERGLTPGSIASYLPTIRRFLQEACNASDLGKISQEKVIGYIERHARDWSPSAGRTMCSSLRAFLRYLHHRGLNPHALAGCVPSIRRWKLATLPTCLPGTQVQKVLDCCDRTTAMGRRDYAILMMLARLGLRATEAAALTLDDIDWRTGEMHVCRKGRKRAPMPIPPDVGAAIVAYLRNGRPKSSCRRLFLRTRAPRIGFAPGAINMIAKRALDRAGVIGCAGRGGHIFRRSLATQLLRSGATLTEIGQLLGHESHDTTRIYAKVDIEALRSLSLPWPGASR